MTQIARLVIAIASIGGFIAALYLLLTHQIPEENRSLVEGLIWLFAGSGITAVFTWYFPKGRKGNDPYS